MHRLILSAAVVAALGVTTYGAPATWDWYYDANVTPNISGSVESPQGTPQSSFSPYLATPSGSAGGGLYSASTLGTDSGAGWQYPVGASNLSYFNSSTGYTVEWKLKIDEIENDYAADPGTGGLGSIGMEMEDGSSSVNEWFFLSFLREGSQYKAYLMGGNMNIAAIANIDNTSFHTYRVTVLGTTAKLYVDGNLAGSVTDPRTDVPTDVLRWSDSTGANDASYTVDYLYVTGQGAFAPEAVPEPAMLGLVALGGLAMVRRRQR